MSTLLRQVLTLLIPESILWLLTLGVDTSIAGVETSCPELVSLFSWPFEHRSLHDLRDVFLMDVYDLHYVQSSEIRDFLLHLPKISILSIRLHCPKV